ncbi:glycoside hydrolase family 37 protein [Gongronella butleri]|nr:glycoside hydrolase family 37 protein [Gongronella butleri]
MVTLTWIFSWFFFFQIPALYTRDDEEESVLRRASHEDQSKARKFLINVAETRQRILEREDTDNDLRITIEDRGPKTISLGTADSGGYRKLGIRGNYMLSNLLQELTLAEDYGRKFIVLDEARLSENPVTRLSRMIRNTFWRNLTRCMDADGLERICADTKDRTAATDNRPRIYVPHGEKAIYDYYRRARDERPHLKDLQVEYLPEDITAEFVRDINDRPGILALAMRPRRDANGMSNGVSDASDLEGLSFVVPGGRFNEMYGWDSYFSALGLILDGYIDLAKNMCEHFAFEIKHYGKILNANRSYYLCRSQPPLFTDMALRVYKELQQNDQLDEEQDGESNEDWLRRMLQAAIKEYHEIWMSSPRLDEATGLSRYRPDGLGIPPETEASHFDHVITQYAQRAGLSISEYDARYTSGEIREPALDSYFLHDRGVRESGHDTTYRLDDVCGDLATIDLNALLYRYEMDIGDAIDHLLGGDLKDMHGVPQTSDQWLARAQDRKDRINKYLWNERDSLYYDYDTIKKKQISYESVTAYWALWAGCASAEQAEALTTRSLYKFENKGGLVSGTEKSRGHITLDRPNRQWDFPFGWAPHQILAWEGFARYEMTEVANRLAYRWLYMITKSFVEFNGVVPEKYDVVSLSHKVEVEYGNQGTDFKFVPREGFGWMNASYQVGLTYLSRQATRALSTLADPDDLFAKSMEMEQQLQPQSIQMQAAACRRQSILAVRELQAELGNTITTKVNFNPNRTNDMLPADDDASYLFAPSFSMVPASPTSSMASEPVHPTND